MFFNESHHEIVGTEIPALRSEDSIKQIRAENAEFDDLDCVREYGWQKSVFSEWLNNPDYQDEQCFWSNRLRFSDVTTVDHYGARWTDFTRRIYQEILAAENALCKN